MDNMNENLMKPELTLIVMYFEIQREIENTLFSLSTDFQVGIKRDEYEVLIVNNGSKSPPNLEFAKDLDLNLRLINIETQLQSPVKAINEVARNLESTYLGIFIDGARIASPGLLFEALTIMRSDSQNVVGCRGRYLGWNFQVESIREGYSKLREDELLEEIKWKQNGYKLFEISHPDESAGTTLLSLPSESNSLFLSLDIWKKNGGYNEKFMSPGGGYANLELWGRIISSREIRTVILLGETTFHQIHGGVATNAVISRQQEFHDEYTEIAGSSYSHPVATPYFYGELSGRKFVESEELVEPLRLLWERDRAMEERDRAMEERDRAMEERDRAMEERDRAMEERDRAIEIENSTFWRLTYPSRFAVASLKNLIELFRSK
jgi:hypothetical protein